MLADIGNKLLSVIKPQDTPFEVRDSKLKGFLLRVQPSGQMSYICQYGRGKRTTIGKTDKITPAQARDKAKELLSRATLGEDLQALQNAKQAITYGDYLTREYGPWVEAHNKTGKATHARLKAAFPDLQKKKLNEIDAELVEKWRTARLRAGIARSTVNRDIVALKASLSKVPRGTGPHPLQAVKPLKVDDAGKVRYLEPEEEKRLRKALDAREEKARAGRDSANAWRAELGHELLPDLRKQAFVDHLKPITLLALNTGLRRGELFSLTWDNVNLRLAQLTVTGETAKSQKTRHVPLNEEALETLRGWKKQSDGPLVFANLDGDRMGSIKTSWRELVATAKVKDFRFHDCRHHFASRLVMAGVDLNTVRELLGHGDIKMTLRYAHLAPKHKAAAVALLGARL